MSEYVSKFNVLDNTGILVKDTEGRSLISDLDDRKVEKLTELVFIGDSFGTGWQVGDTYLAENVRIPNRIAEYLGLNLHNYSENGAGYTINTLFNTLATNANNDTTFDHNKVKYVVLLGGINDALSNADVDRNTFMAAFNLVTNNLRGYFPNSKVYAFLNWASVSFTTTGIWKIANYMQRTAYNSLAHPDVYGAMVNVGFADAINSDNIHPNDYGAHRISSYIYNVINFGSGAFAPVGYSLNVTNENNYWNTSNLFIGTNKYFVTICGTATALKEVTSSSGYYIGALWDYSTFFGEFVTTCFDITNQVCRGIKLVPSLTDSSNKAGSIQLVIPSDETIAIGTSISMNINIPRIPFGS